MDSPSLTPAQKKEFPTPLLRAFALSYLRFRHSSPYTTKRKIFRYFEPLGPDEISDESAMFGANREEAYAELLKDFRACAMVGAFDGLMAERRHYWKSETLPGLVILRKWLGPENNKGD